MPETPSTIPSPFLSLFHHQPAFIHLPIILLDLMLDYDSEVLQLSLFQLYQHVKDTPQCKHSNLKAQLTIFGPFLDHFAADLNLFSLY
jgi:hypothetical protein